MFGFSKKNPEPEKNTVSNDTSVDAEQSADTRPPAKSGWLDRLKKGLSRTREILNTDVQDLFQTRKVIDEALLEEVENLLLSADVGVSATQSIIDDLTQRLSRQQLKDGEALFEALQENILSMLQPVEQPLKIPAGRNKPFVILMVGINGAGKTTTIGKLAKYFQADGHSVMLAAGDTFRAAAVEQLQTWGERNNVPVIAQQGRADSASVIYDALQSATAKNIGVLIADTAGRLHTQSGLMDELKKVRRVITKLDESAPHEVMLVVDAGNGQNVLMQAKQFHETVQISGITVTKLDGTAKGGVVIALARQMDFPIRFIGVGEQIDDLRPFVASEFVRALLGRD